MKSKVLVGLVVAVLFIMFLDISATAQQRRKTSSDILKEGLLGAGAGAVGGAASGGKGGDIWKGALAGAGVNIVGGALLDSISGQPVSDVDAVDSASPRAAYSDGYEAGYRNGYKKGYTDGYKEAIAETQTTEP